MKKMLWLNRFIKSDNGVAAVEMALVLPFLVLLFLGTVEISRFFLISKRVSNVSASIAQMLSTSSAVRPKEQLYFLASSIYSIPTIEPDTLSAGGSVWGSHNVSMASVEFVPVDKNCQTSNCNFDAMVRFTYSVDPDQMRPCGKATKVADGIVLTSNTLPASLYGPGSVIVADVSYAYKPLFGSRFFGDITLFKSSFMAPRYMTVVPFGPNAPGLRICS
jgi:Flp pilus assembly protein TadG